MQSTQTPTPDGTSYPARHEAFSHVMKIRGVTQQHFDVMHEAERETQTITDVPQRVNRQLAAWSVCGYMVRTIPLTVLSVCSLAEEQPLDANQKAW